MNARAEGRHVRPEPPPVAPDARVGRKIRSMRDLIALGEGTRVVRDPQPDEPLTICLVRLETRDGHTFLRLVSEDDKNVAFSLGRTDGAFARHLDAPLETAVHELPKRSGDAQA